MFRCIRAPTFGIRNFSAVNTYNTSIGWQAAHTQHARPKRWAKRKMSVSTYTWYIVAITNRFGQQTIANLPCKYTRAFSLIIGNFLYDWRRCYSWFGAADRSWLYRTSFVISVRAKKCWGGGRGARKQNIFDCSWP